MNNIAIFASGSGTNAERIASYFKNSPTIHVALIATENPRAFVLERAKRLGIPFFVFTQNELNGGAVLKRLLHDRIDFVVLAGFLKMIPSQIVKAYPNHIVNIHPALLPRFGGKGMYGERVHKAVIEAGETESGITIHYVNEQYDEGDIIFQARCPVFPSDTPETLAKRVHELEYMHYPRVIEQLLIKV